MIELRAIFYQQSAKELRALKKALRNIGPDLPVKTEPLTENALVSVVFSSQKQMEDFIVEVEKLGLKSFRWSARSIPPF